MLAVLGSGTFKKGLPHFKRERAVSRGECLNSPQGLRRLSQSEQPKGKASTGTKSAISGKGEEDLVEKKDEEVWKKLVGRANEDKIFINGHPVTALLDTGSQVTHVSQDFSLAKGIKIHPINQLVNIEGTGRTTLNIWGILKLNYPSLWIHILLKLKPSYWFCPLLNIRKR